MPLTRSLASRINTYSTRSKCLLLKVGGTLSHSLLAPLQLALSQCSLVPQGLHLTLGTVSSVQWNGLASLPQPPSGTAVPAGLVTEPLAILKNCITTGWPTH